MGRPIVFAYYWRSHANVYDHFRVSDLVSHVDVESDSLDIVASCAATADCWSNSDNKYWSTMETRLDFRSMRAAKARFGAKFGKVLDLLAVIICFVLFFVGIEFVFM